MKTKGQISFAVTSAPLFLLHRWIVQVLYFLIPKFPTSSHLQCLDSSACVEPKLLVFSHKDSITGLPVNLEQAPCKFVCHWDGDCCLVIMGMREWVHKSLFGEHWAV